MSVLESINYFTRTILLENKHFTNGTVILNNNYYIITNPKTYKTERIEINLKPNEKLVYKFTENIMFNPNVNKNKMFIDQGIPEPEQFKSNGGYYDDMAYGIGFFAALVVTGEDYIIDLNNCILEQSYQHSIRQRFFSIIELANSPFLSKVGPHNFIYNINCAKYITIKNGHLGLSSHHGIHGNNNVNITFENLTFKDFEVAAISLNGSVFTTMKDINVSNNNHNVSVLGIWSSALFLYPYIKHLYNTQKYLSLIINNKSYTTMELYKEYLYVIEKTFNELMDYKYTKNVLFNNPKKVVDGPAYGIILNKINVAVNGFPKTNDNSNYNHKLININIEKIKGFNNEIPALVRDNDMINNDNLYSTKNIQNDVVGSVLQTQNYYLNNEGKKVPLTINDEGIYIGNIVSNIQLLVAKAIHLDIPFNGLSVSVNSIKQDTIEWVENAMKIKDTELYYIFQGDTMHHVIKGVIAFRLDTIYNTEIRNVFIQNIDNLTDCEVLLYNDLIGLNEDDIKPEFKEIYMNYKNKLEPSHKMATYACNQKSYVRGISMANTTNNILDDITIRYLSSKFDNVIPIDFHDEIQSVSGSNILRNINV